MPDNYNSLTADYLYNAKKKDNTVVAVTPATPGATGFTQIFRKKMGENYVDVDIAEQHAVGYVSGLAKVGETNSKIDERMEKYHLAENMTNCHKTLH